MFKIIWRIEPNGDFHEQAFLPFESASEAVAQWRRVWRLHESDCVVFKIEKL